MRLLLACLLLGLVAWPAAQAHADASWPPANHSPSVADFFWSPREPARGEPMRATLTLNGSYELDGVLLRICRAQNYACRVPIEMTDTQREGVRPQFAADVPWDGRFYKGVSEVGFAVILQFANGTEEISPRAPWPGPVDLPEGAGTYYFFDLPEEPPNVAGPSLIVAALAVVAALAWRRP